MAVKSLIDYLTEVLGANAKARVSDIAARAAGSPELAAKLNTAAQIMEDTGNRTPLLKLIASKEVGQWGATPARKAPQGPGRGETRAPISGADWSQRPDSYVRKRIAENADSLPPELVARVESGDADAIAEAHQLMAARATAAEKRMAKPLPPPPGPTGARTSPLGGRTAEAAARMPARQIELPVGDRPAQVLDRLQGPPTQYQPTAPEIISQQFDDIFRSDVMPARPEGPGMSTLTYGQREAMNPPRAPQPSYDETMAQARGRMEAGYESLGRELDDVALDLDQAGGQSIAEDAGRPVPEFPPAPPAPPPGRFDGIDASFLPAPALRRAETIFENATSEGKANFLGRDTPDGLSSLTFSALRPDEQRVAAQRMGVRQESGMFDGIDRNASAPRAPNYELGSDDWMAMSGAADRSRPRAQTGNLRNQPNRQLQAIAADDAADRAARARAPKRNYGPEAALAAGVGAGAAGLYMMTPRSESDAPAIDSTDGAADLAAETSPPPAVRTPLVPNITSSPEPFSAGTMDYGPSITFDYSAMARDKIRQANEIQLQYGRQTPESLALIREADALYLRAAEERRNGFHPPIMPVDQQDAMTSAIRNRRAG